MQHPQYGFSYAVTTGTYVGEIFVFVDSNEDEYQFISIPKNINRSIPKDKFEFALDNQIIDPFQQIDSDVFELLEKQFEYNNQKH